MSDWILVIDDDTSNLKMASKILSEEQMRVSCLKSGEDAIKFLQNNRPDLILLDVHMPGMDGFETILRRVMEKCDGNYTDIVAVLNQEMVGNNAGTSGSYMPTDTQMHDALINANVYGRPTLRIILDRLELSENPAPVDLSALSIEHLMPQTPTEEWLEELDVDEETYSVALEALSKKN